MPAVRKTQKKLQSFCFYMLAVRQSCKLGGMNKKRGVVFIPYKTIQGVFLLLSFGGGKWDPIQTKLERKSESASFTRTRKQQKQPFQATIILMTSV